MAKSPRPGAEVLPVLPLRGTVAFPGEILQLVISRPESIKAVEAALDRDSRLLLVAQKNDSDSPGWADLHAVGTVALIQKLVRLPDDSVRVTLQGAARARWEAVEGRGEPPLCLAAALAEQAAKGNATVTWRKRLLRVCRQLVDAGGELPGEIVQMAAATEDAGRAADLLASHLPLETPMLQAALEALNPAARLRLLAVATARELKEGGLRAQIAHSAQGAMDKAQREYFLQKQMEAIRRELGEESEGEAIAREYREKAAKVALPEPVKELFNRQLGRLERIGTESGEAAGLRNHLETLLEVPWPSPGAGATPPPVAQVREKLEKEHFGLEKIKRRILEFAAVRRHEPGAPPPRICLLGPPGVGKTSLARAIAHALDRPFTRASLGGVRDEAEIRGHRRTYIGAMPGRIVQGLIAAKSPAPVFLLDELDKMSATREGDPASALLEVMDPEQNKEFRDHYLGLPLDLSQIIFIATANDAEGIPDALFDRFEYLELRGYSEEEKVKIAATHLWPRLMAAHGGERAGLKRPPEALVRTLIRRYTYEAGLRDLSRLLEKLVRDALLRAEEKGGKPVIAGENRLTEILGPPPQTPESALSEAKVGVATGLAWTAGGGDILLLECVAFAGSGTLNMTGQLGEVMRESGQAAVALLKSRGKAWGADPAAFGAYDFHLHIPAGAVPKDGPSAGVTLLITLLSLLTGRPVRRDLGMTGELTLRGEVLAVGGIPEKLMAARRAGLKEVLLPEANRKDEPEIPVTVRKALKLTYIKSVEDAVKHALLKRILPPLKPTDEKKRKSRAKKPAGRK